MPFLRKPSSSAAADHAFDAISTEEEGFEVIQDRGRTHEAHYVDLHGFEVFVGLSHQGDMDDRQHQFINEILERAEVTKTAFFAHFSPLRLTERTLASKDPAFQDMCSRGIELLGVHPDLDDGAIALAARRTADAAEAFLNTPAARDPQLRKFGLEVRLRARETMQQRIKRPPGRVDKTTDITNRSDAFVLVTRERARLMAEFLGVHRAPEVPGVDFILDAHGKVAYAFKPMTASAAVEAVCMSRLHDAVSVAMRDQAESPSVSTAMIVSMPGRPAHGTDDVDDVDDVLGLLMIPPTGFDLGLAAPEDGDGVGRQRLADALARPLTDSACDHLALTALCAGEHRLPLGGVLVYEGGRTWMLDREPFVADRPARTEVPATVPFRGHAASAAGRAPTDMPMASHRLEALARLDVNDMARYVDTRWKATRRENRLLAEALGKTGEANTDVLYRLWPSKDDVARLTLRLAEVRNWAEHCVRNHDHVLAAPDLVEVEEQSDAVSKASSIRWFLSTFAPTVADDHAQA